MLSTPYYKKIRFFMFLLCGAFAIILFRLYQLQIKQMHDFYILGQKNFIHLERVMPPRGNILDCNGKILATNRPITNLYWQGTGSKSTKDQLNIMKTVEEILQTSLEEQRPSLIIAEKHGGRVLLASDLSFEQLSRVLEKLPNCPHIHLVTRFKRYYPHCNLASHLVGYLGQADYDPIGKMGLEKILNDDLKGEDGEIQKIINSVGKSLEEQELKQPLAGHDIHTTLDLTLQQLIEQAFPPEYSGTMIVMDPKTGALRALISRPTFDPNIFLSSINQEQWQELVEKKAFLNRAFNASYPPASIFKLVTISAALEQGVVSQNALVNCRGSYHFGGYRHWCMQHMGHGVLTVKEAVAKSCNILFYHLGKQMSIDTIAEYAKRFGLGQKTNMLFPDQEGLVPTSRWKLMNKKERWWPGETLSAAIGQSFLLVTPIQISRMIAAIFEGYLVTPRLLEQEEVKKEPLHISKKTREFLKDSMRSVVSIGTGINVSHISDIEIFAKTGTAQTSSLELRNATNKYLEHGWFVAYFRYKHQPPLTMVILVEHAASSSIATGIAKKFLLAYRSSFQQPDNAILTAAPEPVEYEL